MTVAPSVTYRPPVWHRFLSVHTLLTHLLPVMWTLQQWGGTGVGWTPQQCAGQCLMA